MLREKFNILFNHKDFDLNEYPFKKIISLFKRINCEQILIIIFMKWK